MPWQPSFGAVPKKGGARFRVWAPNILTLEVVQLADGNRPVFHPLAKQSDGCFTGIIAGMESGERYRYRINEKDQFPDPASRFQPEGVHGPSELIDPSCYQWTDHDWQGIDFDQLMIYELHAGAFSPEGTFAGVINKLPYLQDLGITAIELMPAADFPGQRNWGYDGVCLFAPARCYGRPDDLRRLVDRAHEAGLAVLLDVVYNHLGPDGNYTGVFSPHYTSQKHDSPWGKAMNFDEEHSEMVRAFFIDNALHWLHEYHMDGLRLDATHAIYDDSDKHFLAELTTRVHESLPGKRIHLIAEDHRNLNYMVQPVDRGGWGLDGVWADDFHHQMRRHLAGDSDGYFRDFSGTTRDLAKTVQQGWYFTGQESKHLGELRGTDPSEISPRAFITCLQNHDQIGNRAFGERLHHQIDLPSWRAATTLFLCAPQTPLLFMGQEWAATTPFQFFTDHNEELGKLVTAGRRREFRHFAAFADEKQRDKIPDPQAEATFLASRLNWPEIDEPPHAGILNLYQTLLDLRNKEPALQSARREDYQCFAADDSSVALVRQAENAQTVCVVCQFTGAGNVHLKHEQFRAKNGNHAVLLTTEDETFATDPQPIRVEFFNEELSVQFSRPGAIVVRL